MPQGYGCHGVRGHRSVDAPGAWMPQECGCHGARVPQERGCPRSTGAPGAWVPRGTGAPGALVSQGRGCHRSVGAPGSQVEPNFLELVLCFPCKFQVARLVRYSHLLNHPTDSVLGHLPPTFGMSKGFLWPSMVSGISG